MGKLTNVHRAVLIKAGTGMLNEDYVGLVQKNAEKKILKVICRYVYTVTNRPTALMTSELNVWSA